MHTAPTKNFDTWNELKKSVQGTQPHLLYGKREVWWAHLGINAGFEQDGTDLCAALASIEHARYLDNDHSGLDMRDPRARQLHPSRVQRAGQ